MPRRKRLSPCHPLKPATLWIRVVSMASARVIAGRMVVSRRASIDFPLAGRPGLSACVSPGLRSLPRRDRTSR